MAKKRTSGSGNPAIRALRPATDKDLPVEQQLTLIRLKANAARATEVLESLWLQLSRIGVETVEQAQLSMDAAHAMVNNPYSSAEVIEAYETAQRPRSEADPEALAFLNKYMRKLYGDRLERYRRAVIVQLASETEGGLERVMGDLMTVLASELSEVESGLRLEVAWGFLKREYPHDTSPAVFTALEQNRHTPDDVKNEVIAASILASVGGDE